MRACVGGACLRRGTHVEVEDKFQELFFLGHHGIRGLYSGRQPFQGEHLYLLSHFIGPIFQMLTLLLCTWPLVTLNVLMGSFSCYMNLPWLLFNLVKKTSSGGAGLAWGQRESKSFVRCIDTFTFDSKWC